MLRIRKARHGALESTDTLSAEAMELGPNESLWVDVEHPEATLMQALKERFDLHRLAIEDCFHVDLRPKLEAYQGHHFIVLQSFTEDTSTDQLQLHELHMFLGPHWLVTVHENPHPALGDVCRRIETDVANTLGRGADHLAFMLTDIFIASNLSLVDNVNEQLEAVEDALFLADSQNPMEKVFALKRRLVEMRRVLAPQRDVVNQLSLRGIPEISERASLYFRRSGDSSSRLSEQLDAAKERLGNVREAHFAMVANRANEVTKQLTLFASIFMPLSFLVGFFGQNFEALNQPAYFGAMLALALLIPVTMGVYFWRRRWL
jgi:magnesium transporter